MMGIEKALTSRLFIRDKHYKLFQISFLFLLLRLYDDWIDRFSATREGITTFHYPQSMNLLLYCKSYTMADKK